MKINVIEGENSFECLKKKKEENKALWLVLLLQEQKIKYIS